MNALIITVFCPNGAPRPTALNLPSTLPIFTTSDFYLHDNRPDLTIGEQKVFAAVVERWVQARRSRIDVSRTGHGLFTWICSVRDHGQLQEPVDGANDSCCSDRGSEGG